MLQAAETCIQVAEERTLRWLALALTPGLGPTRSRRLVELFGSIGAVFQASLTELEATGIMAMSAQSIGTGNSRQLADEEVTKARAAGAQILPWTTLCIRHC